MAWEQRVGRLEGAYEQVNRRLEDLGRSVEPLRGDMNGLRNEMNSLRGEMNSRLNTVYVLLGGMWATMVAGFIALYLTN